MRVAVDRGLRTRKAQKHELTIALDFFDSAARKILFEGSGIVDEIGFAERDGDNAAPGNGLLQSASYGFDFGKFWHLEVDTANYRMERDRPGGATMSWRRPESGISAYFF